MTRVVKKDRCTGCTACMNICPRQCIEMKKDNYGFLYPVISNLSTCLDCGACERSCPVYVNQGYVDNKLPLAYAALSKDEPVRMNSSSGGIFTEIAKRIIAQNGVVYGAAYDEKYAVHHYCIDNTHDLYKLRGAKYAESNLGNSFIDILDRLKKGQFVLFSGTPCQVAGLKSFLRKDYDNLFCVDFVCHGVPSPMAWKAYIEYRSKIDAEGKLPTDINLRSKKSGWSRYQYSNVFQYTDGTEHSVQSSKSLFMKLFVGDYISRPSCENCQFKGYNRVSDITLGDFWGIWDIAPEMDDNKGTSVVLIQSEKGRELWDSIKDRIKFKEVTLEQASQQNPSMLQASKANKKRDVALDKIRNGKIADCENLFVVQKPSVMNRVKNKMSRLYHKTLIFFLFMNVCMKS